MDYASSASRDTGDCSPVLTRRYHTFGLRNTAFGGMILVSLLFAALAAFLLRRCSHFVVWTVSLLLCSYLSFWIYTLSRTLGATAIFFRVSYGALLAFTSGVLVGPTTGMAMVHLNTAWTAGLLGYSLAQYRLHIGSERAADEAAARTPSKQSEEEMMAIHYGVFMTGLMTFFMAARVVWLVFFPCYSDENTMYMVLELSVLIWIFLHSWALLMNRFLLHEALVSLNSMVYLYCYYMASCFPCILCALVGPWLWVYYFGLEMMAMAAFFGYILAVHARCKAILARDQPFFTDLELGDALQESASVSTGKNA